MKKRMLSLSLVLAMTVPAIAMESSAEELRTVTLLGQECRFNYANMMTEDRERYECWQQLEDILAERNLQLDCEVVARDQFSTVIQTRTASGDLPDIVNLSCLEDAAALRLGMGGMLMPINKLLQENGGEEAWAYINEKLPFIVKRLTAEDGNIYWLPSVYPIMTYQGKAASTGTTMLIRQDWLDKAGLEMPKTAEEFKEVLRTFQEQDMNGNGVKDEVLILDPATNNGSLFGNGVAQWFGLGDNIVSYDIANKKVICPWYSEGLKPYLEYVKSLIDEGLIDTNLIGLSSNEQVDQKMAENAVAAENSWMMETWLEPMIDGVSDALLAPMEPLDAVEGVNPYIILESSEATLAKFAVSSDCEDLEAVADLFNYLYSDEYAEFGTWGVKGESFDDSNGYNEYLGVYTGDNKVAQAEQGKTTINDLVGYDALLPTIRYATLDAEINSVVPEKAEYQKNIIDYEYVLAMDIRTFQALPSEEQASRLAEIKTDLETYSREILANIVLGRSSIDDLDSYIEELKSMGLDEYIQINQELCDRYNAE